MTVRKNIIAGWLAHLVTVLIGFFLMPYTLRVIGETPYGAWLFINAIAGYSGLIYSGFGATICRYVADLSARNEIKQLNAVVSTIQCIYGGSAAIVLVLSGVFAWIAPGLTDWAGVSLTEVRCAIMIVGATIALAMVSSVYGGVLIGTQRLDVKRAIEVATGVVRLLLTVFCLHAQYGLVTLALIFLAVTIFENILLAAFAYRQTPGLSVAPWNARFDVMRECFGFSAFNALSLAAENLIYFTDTVLIGIFLGPKAVIPYQIGLRIAQMIQVPVAQIGEAVLPRAGELYAKREGDQLGQLVARGMGLAFLLSSGFLIGATYFGDMLIHTWMGQSFDSSHAVLVLLVAAQTIALPTVVTRKALLGIGKVRLPAVMDLGEAGMNLLLSLVLIQWWGVIGVAWGTLIPLIIVELLILLPYAVKELNISRSSLFHTVLASQVPALAALLIYSEIVSRAVDRSGWGPLVAITLGGGAVLVGVRWLTHKLETRSRDSADSELPNAKVLAG